MKNKALLILLTICQIAVKEVPFEIMYPVHLIIMVENHWEVSAIQYLMRNLKHK